MSRLLNYSIKELENSPEVCFASIFVLHSPTVGTYPATISQHVTSGKALAGTQVS